MTNYVPVEVENLEEIKTEVNNFIFGFLGAATHDDVAAEVLKNRVRMMIYKGIPLEFVDFISPKLGALLDQMSIQYGDVLYNDIWVGASNATLPVLSTSLQKCYFIIPCISSENFKLQYYNYTGSVTTSTQSNDNVNFTTIQLPNEMNLLTRNETITNPGPGWMKVGNFHTISNWSSDICVYLTIVFEHQDLIEYLHF
jgi:hypothetical protein